MKDLNELYEKVFEEMSRVYLSLEKEIEDQTNVFRREKMKKFFSILSIEEIIDLYEMMEML